MRPGVVRPVAMQRPLRRLAHVLGEAAEINEAVNRQRQP
jgi:hypothetical protein